MENEKRLKEIKKRQDKLDKILEEKDNNWDFSKSFDDYIEMRSYWTKELSMLNREERMIMPIKYEKLSTYGDVMSLEHFKGNVKCGGFINYDGFGLYVKDGKESNIEIYPSDIKNGSIREGFDTIIWFNR